MESFFRNLRTLLLALVLALAVWVSAVTAADPDEVKEYPQPVTLQVVGQDPGLVVVGTLPGQVKIVLRAPRSAWNQLATGNNQVRAILDLSGLVAGDYQLRIQPQVSVRPVRVVSVDPQVLDVKLEPLASVTLPINLAVSGEPAVGFEAGTARLDITHAVISGPQSQISQIARAEADLNIAGLRQDVQTVLPVQVLDANGNSVPGLTISPKNIQVGLPVTQQGGYRDIAVKVNVRGQQAGGYRVTNISVFPPVITVFSKNPAVVNDLPGFVETEPLNLNGESQDLDLHLKLNLPTGISIVGDQTVQVQVGIAPIEGSLSLNGIPVEVVGVAPSSRRAGPASARANCP